PSGAAHFYVYVPPEVDVLKIKKAGTANTYTIPVSPAGYQFPDAGGLACAGESVGIGVDLEECSEIIIFPASGVWEFTVFYKKNAIQSPIDISMKIEGYRGGILEVLRQKADSDMAV